MYKLVVSAFDGALIDKEESIPTSTMIELDNIRQKSLFCVATGRDLDTILYYNQSFPFIDYIICFNGALVYDSKMEKIIYKKTLGNRIVKKISEMFNNYKINYGSIGKDIFKIEIHGSKNKLTKVISLLEEANLNISFILRKLPGDYFIEIVSKDISKLSGVKVICKKKKIKLVEVMAFGSDVNDLDLIKNVGYGVAMKNASSIIKKIARKVTMSNEDKGMEIIMKEYF